MSYDNFPGAGWYACPAMDTFFRFGSVAMARDAYFGRCALWTAARSGYYFPAESGLQLHQFGTVFGLEWLTRWRSGAVKEWRVDYLFHTESY